MGLDSFKTQENNDSNNEDEEDIYEKNSTLEDSGELNLVQSDGESDKHFNTKSNIAIQMDKMGWNVYVEKGIRIDQEHHIIADIIVSGKPEDDNIELNIPDVESMIIEIGSYSQSRARKALNVVDIVLWIAKGKPLSDAVVIQDLVPEDKQHHFKSTYTYTNAYGNEIEPKLDNIYVDRYKQIAKELLAAFNTITDPAKAADYINDSTEYSISEHEAEVILTDVGFI